MEPDDIKESEENWENLLAEAESLLSVARPVGAAKDIVLKVEAIPEGRLEG